MRTLFLVIIILVGIPAAAAQNTAVWGNGAGSWVGR